MYTFFKTNNRYIFFVYFFLALPVYFWFGQNSFILAGDFGWPQFFSNFLQYTGHVWDASVNYGYSATRQNAFFFPFAVYGYSLEKLFSPGPHIELIIFYFSFFFSGLGMHLVAKKLGMNIWGAFFCGFFYMFSPYALAIAWVPAYGISFAFYCFLPLNIYLFLSFIESNDLRIKIASLLGTFFSYLGTNFANPTYLIIYAIFIVFFFIIKIFDANLNKKQVLLNSFVYGIVFILFNMFWILPFLYDLGNQFQSASNQTAGLISDIDTVKLNSVKIADAFRMTGIWALRGEQWGNYYYSWHKLLDTPLYIIASFLIPLLLLLRFVFKSRGLHNKIIIMALFLFAAVILNSGMLKGGLLKHSASLFYSSDYLLRAFRSVFTKIGILLVIPIVYIAAESLEILIDKCNTTLKKLAVAVILVGVYLLTVGQPFLTGEIIKQDDKKLPGYNVSIPQEYYALRTSDFSQKIDARYLSLPLPKSYNHLLQWKGQKGYNGADFIRNFLHRPALFLNDGSPMTSALISCINNSGPNCSALLDFMNVRFVLQHTDIPDYMRNTYLTRKTFKDPAFTVTHTNNYFNISRNQHNKHTLSHFYVPNIIFMTKDASIDALKAIVLQDTNNKIALLEDSSGKKSRDKKFTGAKIQQTPVIEYKKISATRYRVRMHYAKGIFPLIFSEGFNRGWKLYVAQYSSSLDKNKYDPAILQTYKLLKNNEKDQAQKDELANFIKNGWISTLGDFKNKQIVHKKWTINSEKIDSIENYSIDFISKDFNGTIQNDNLPDGSMFETWFKSSAIAEHDHIMANGFANSWLMDIDKLCASGADCKKNNDGSFDLEVIIEFWPQRLFHVGIFFSGIILLLCIALLLYAIYRKKNKKILIK